MKRCKHQASGTYGDEVEVVSLDHELGGEGGTTKTRQWNKARSVNLGPLIATLRKPEHKKAGLERRPLRYCPRVPTAGDTSRPSTFEL